MMAGFAETLRSLGFSSYNEYLTSDHWTRFRESYRTSGRTLRCSICGRNRVQLHHKTYANLGREEFDDIEPLCRQHHSAVHQWLKDSKLFFVEHTDKAIEALRGIPVKPDYSKKQLSKHKRAAKKKRRWAGPGLKPMTIEERCDLLRSAIEGVKARMAVNNKRVIRVGKKKVPAAALPVFPVLERRKRKVVVDPHQPNAKANHDGGAAWEQYLKTRRKPS